MAVKSMSLKTAIKDAFRVFQFDQWIRFYFVVEKEDKKLFVEIPEETLERIKEEYNSFHSLAEIMDGVELDYQRNQDAVCAHIAAQLDGAKYDPSVMPKVFDSPQYKIEMYILNVWLKLHEQHLDANPVFFDDWEEMYTEWNKMDQVKDYRAKLEQSGDVPVDPACNTKQ